MDAGPGWYSRQLSASGWSDDGVLEICSNGTELRRIARPGRAFIPGASGQPPTQFERLSYTTLPWLPGLLVGDRRRREVARAVTTNGSAGGLAEREPKFSKVSRFSGPLELQGKKR